MYRQAFYSASFSVANSDRSFPHCKLMSTLCWRLKDSSEHPEGDDGLQACSPNTSKHQDASSIIAILPISLWLSESLLLLMLKQWHYLMVGNWWIDCMFLKTSEFRFFDGLAFLADSLQAASATTLGGSKEDLQEGGKAEQSSWAKSKTWPDRGCDNDFREGQNSKALRKLERP